MLQRVGEHVRCGEDAPTVQAVHCAGKSHLALQIPAPGSGVHRVKPRASAPGGPTHSAPAPGGRAACFPSLSSHTRPPQGFAEPGAEPHRLRGRSHRPRSPAGP